MGAQHGQVDAHVVALGALVRLGAGVIAHVVVEMVLVLGDKRALGALEQLVGLDVLLTLMHPVVLLAHALSRTLLAFVHFAAAAACYRRR